MQRGGVGTRKEEEEKKEFVLLPPFCRTSPLCYTEHLTKIRNSQCGKKKETLLEILFKFQTRLFSFPATAFSHYLEN